MTRLGWGLLILFLAVAAIFGSMLRFGGVYPRNRGAVRLAPPPLREHGLLAMPVAGVSRDSLTDNWGDPRDGGARRHHGTDIMAPGGTPVTAAAAGTVEKLYNDARGGVTLYERSADRRWIYYYAHLSGYAQGLREGRVVRAGDPLGFVGDTGDAGPGNYHLHFGLTRMRPGQRWWEGEDVDPYPALARRRGRVLGRLSGGG